MSEIQKTAVNGAVTTPPSIKTLAREADPTVGRRMEITPDLAREWLETRGNNRKVSDSVVNTYAKDMAEDRWVFNGAPIQFDEDGKLLNGQHRLWAVIESGVTIDSVVQWGIPRESQATIDAGAKWQTKDILYMQGEKNAACLTATLRWLKREEGGNMLSSDAMSNSAASEVLDRHPNVRHSVDFVHAYKLPMPPAAAAYLHYRVSPEDQDKADEFFRRLSDGVNLAHNSPIYRLRERLNSVKGQARMHREEQLALCIIAWNSYRSGREMKQLKWVRSGRSGDKLHTFPQIEGAAVLNPRNVRPKPRIRSRPTKGGLK